MPAHRRGATLIELLVVLMILGVIASVAALALEPLDASAPGDEARARIERAREEAIRRGRSVTITVRLHAAEARGDSTPAVLVTARPDGSLLAPPALAHARLSGRVMSGGAER